MLRYKGGKVLSFFNIYSVRIQTTRYMQKNLSPDFGIET